MEQARVSSASDLQSDVNAWTFILGAGAYVHSGRIGNINCNFCLSLVQLANLSIYGDVKINANINKFFLIL